MANFSLTPNMKLKSIANLETSWFREWLYNFNRLDTHDHTSEKGVQITAAAIADGAITTSKLTIKTYVSPWLQDEAIMVYAHGFPGKPTIVQLQYTQNYVSDSNPGTIVIFGDGSHVSIVDVANITINFAGWSLSPSSRFRICAIYFP